MEVQELKEQIAEKIFDEWGHAESYCGYDFKDIPNHVEDKRIVKKQATSILSLLDSPDSPYVLKSEAEKRIRAAELNDEEIEDSISEFCIVLSGHRQFLKEVSKATIQKVVDLFEVKK